MMSLTFLVSSFFPKCGTRTSVTHSTNALCDTFLFLPHVDFSSELFTEQMHTTWNVLILVIGLLTK